MKQKSKYTLIIAVLLLFLFIKPQSSVFAENKIETMSPQLYSIMQQKQYIDKILEQVDVKDITPELIQNIIYGARVSTYIPNEGYIIPAPDGSYVAFTGMRGIAVGRLPYGAYAIETNEIDKVGIYLPEYFIVENPIRNELFLPMRKKVGKGAVHTMGEVVCMPLFSAPLPRLLENFKRISCHIINFPDKIKRYIALLPIIKKKQIENALVDQNSPGGLAAIRLFQDENGNGKWDDTEKNVRWANMYFKLDKISFEEEIELNQGDNTIVFDRVPANMKYVYQLMGGLILEGVEDIKLAWTDSTGIYAIDVKNNEVVGNTNKIEKGVSYSLIIDKPAKLRKIYIK